MTTGARSVDEPLTLVAKRAAVLEALCEDQLYKPGLIDRLDVSRSTIDRAIDALESAGFVERRELGYEATAAGRLAVECYRDFEVEMDAITDATPVLAALPASLPLPVTKLSEYAVTPIESSYRLFEHVSSLVRHADSYRAVVPTVTDSRQLRLWQTLTVEDGLDCEVLVDTDAFRAQAHEFPSRSAVLADTGTVRVGDAVPSVPFGLVTTGSSDTDDRPASAAGGDGCGSEACETRVFVIATEGNDPVGLVTTTDEAAVDWATSYYESVRAETTEATETVQSARQDRIVTATDSHRLPLALRAEGVRRIDHGYFERREPLPPTTAWRVGLGLPEVKAGFAVSRRCQDGTGDRSLAERLFAEVRTGEHLAILGPPGCGKSTIAKRVACAWVEQTPGSVLYRKSGRGDRFESTTTLEAIVERERERGPVLVVFEDAVRSEANAVFEVLERFHGDDEVAFLFDAREGEWIDPEAFPIDARLEAIRQDHVSVRHVPRLTDAECERLVERAEEITGEPVPVSPEDILADLRQTARGTVGDDEAMAGTVFLLFHRLGRTFDPLADGPDAQAATVLTAHVDRIQADLEAAGEPALEVGILASVCNAAGVRLDPAYLLAPLLAPDVDPDAVEAALDILENEVLFETPRGEPYRGIHESWSVAFLDRLETDHPPDGVRFGRAVSRLLSLADDVDGRSQIAERLGETPGLDAVAVDPTAWVEETVETIFDLGKRHPKLAGCFVDGDAHTIDFPAAAPPDLESRSLVWLGRMWYRGGHFDRAEAAFIAVPQDGDRLACERLLGLAAVAEGRGEYDSGSEYATRCLERARSIEDERIRARADRWLGRMAIRQGEYEPAREYFQRSYDLFRKQNDRHEVAQDLLYLSNVALKERDLSAAEASLHESIDICDELGLRHMKAKVLNNLGLLAKARNHLEEAERYLKQCLELYEEVGNRRGSAETLNNLGLVAKQRNDLEVAVAYLERSIDVKDELGDRRGKAGSLGNLAVVARKRNELERAETLNRQTLELYEAVGDRRGLAATVTNFGIDALQQGDLDSATDRLTRGRELFEAVGDRRGQAAALISLGIVALATGDHSLARDRYRRVRTISSDIEDTRRETEALLRLGIIDLCEGDLDRATEHLTAALDVADSLEDASWHVIACCIFNISSQDVAG